MRMGVETEIITCEVKAKCKELSSGGGSVAEIIKLMVGVLVHLLKQMIKPEV